MLRIDTFLFNIRIKMVMTTLILFRLESVNYLALSLSDLT